MQANIRQYKLLKWYPSLPTHWQHELELGRDVIVSLDSPKDRYTNKDQFFVRREIENNPEFWKKFEEKEHEILSYKGVYTHKIYDKKDCTGELSPNNYKIHSVKRLSDGQVFTVGDKVRHSVVNRNNEHLRYNNWKINSIVLKYNKIRLYSGTGFNITLNGVEHQPTLLFTTEDGVDIYEGDFVYIIQTGGENWYPERFSPKTIKRYLDRNGKLEGFTFSSFEKAQEWINWNKKQYSKKDVTEMIEKYNKFQHEANFWKKVFKK